MTPEAPPLHYRIPYYFGFRLPLRYEGWVRADIARPFFPEVVLVARFLLMFAVLTIIDLLEGDEIAGFSGVTLFVVGVLAVILIIPPYRKWVRASWLRGHAKKWRWQSGGGWNEESHSQGWRDEIGRG